MTYEFKISLFVRYHSENYGYPTLSRNTPQREPGHSGVVADLKSILIQIPSVKNVSNDHYYWELGAEVACTHIQFALETMHGHAPGKMSELVTECLNGFLKEHPDIEIERHH